MKNYITYFLLLFSTIKGQTTDTDINYSFIEKSDSITIDLVGLDSIDSTSLKIVSNFLSKDLGFQINIKTPNFRNKKFYVSKSNTIDTEFFFKNIYNNNITIYLTDLTLVGDESELNGASSQWNSSIIINSNSKNIFTTITHELGHIFGLEHCYKSDCFMSLYFPDMVRNKFCDSCISKIHN